MWLSQLLKKQTEKKLSLSTEHNKVSSFTRRDKISFIYSSLSLWPGLTLKVVKSLRISSKAPNFKNLSFRKFRAENRELHHKDLAQKDPPLPPAFVPLRLAWDSAQHSYNSTHRAARGCPGGSRSGLHRKPRSLGFHSQSSWFPVATRQIPPAERPPAAEVAWRLHPV